MFPEWIASLPSWLLAGLTLGLAASAAVAGLFVAGNRLFPTERDGGAASSASGSASGDERRRAEIREYLRAIGEPYAEDHEIEGRRVAFYLLHREVAITFDAQAYFRLEAAGVETVLCEHEMPGWQLGRRLPFETPAAEAVAAPADAPDPVATAFSELGLSPDADAAEVRAAYRERVKDVHPDQGGDSEAFKRVREAYATARNHAD
ncbi:MAG: J domain-containing protein [Haloferacaceae archaeon]